MLKRILKNERGLTLIELLVVVVILGIVIAIAIPTVGNIIENSKLDAHIANAQQMVAAYKMYAAGEPNPEESAKLATLAEKGYLAAKIKDPHGEFYDADASLVTYDDTEGIYTVTLVGEAGTYINDKDPNDPGEVNRDYVGNNVQ